MASRVFTLCFALVTAAGILLAQQTVTDEEPAGSDGVRTVRDLSYVSSEESSDALRSLDLHLPGAVENPPLVMWIHGGAWAFGDKGQEERLARWFAESGIAFAAIKHRLSPATWRDPGLTEGVTHPAHIKDVARAFAWLVEHASEYRYDSTRLYVGGYSTGAHLAALLATNPRYLESEGLTLDAIRGAIPVAGAFDLEAYYDYTMLFEQKVSEDMPIEFLHVRDETHATLFRAIERDNDDPTRARIIEWVEQGGRASEWGRTGVGGDS